MRCLRYVDRLSWYPQSRMVFDEAKSRRLFWESDQSARRTAGGTQAAGISDPDMADRIVRQRERKSLKNFLRSIAEDAEFVDNVRAAFPELPAFANLRNGAWYAAEPTGFCYFKSTDGHHGTW